MPLQRDKKEGYTPGGPDPAPIAQLKFQMFRRNLQAATLLQAWPS